MWCLDAPGMAKPWGSALQLPCSTITQNTTSGTAEVDKIHSFFSSHTNGGFYRLWQPLLITRTYSAQTWALGKRGRWEKEEWDVSKTGTVRRKCERSNKSAWYYKFKLSPTKRKRRKQKRIFTCFSWSSLAVYLFRVDKARTSPERFPNATRFVSFTGHVSRSLNVLNRWKPIRTGNESFIALMEGYCSGRLEQQHGECCSQLTASGCSDSSLQMFLGKGEKGPGKTL